MSDTFEPRTRPRSPASDPSASSASSDPLTLAVIVGSVRPQRLGVRVAEWVQQSLASDSRFRIDVLDLVQWLAVLDVTLGSDTSEFRTRLAAANAFIAVTPEYNHGYPASLKNAFDSAKHEWRGKPIGFVAYGGVSGGLRAVEQLRQVAAELHMVSVRDAVSFPSVRRVFADQRDAEALRATGSGSIAADTLARMANQLAWWADGRGEVPYPG